MANAADLKRRLLRPWARKGTLFVPPTLPQLHGEMENIKAYVTYSELTGRKPTTEEFVEKLQGMGLKSLMASLSNLIQVLHNDGVGNIELQRRLRDQALTPQRLTRLTTVEQWNQRIIFFPQQILFALKMAIHHSPDTEDPRPNEEFRDALIDILLIASEFLGNLELPEDLGEIEKVIISHLVRDYLMNMTDQFRYMIPRASILYRKLPFEEELLAAHDFMDLPTIFEHATGIPLKDYIAFGFAILGWFVDQSELRQTYNPERQSINPKTFFSKAKVDPALTERLLDTLTHSYESARARIKERGEDPAKFNYDFLPFMEKALYQVKEDAIVPVHLGYLESKFTNAIYWTIHDYLEGENRLKFTRFFGKIFETYVRRCIQRAIPDNPLLARRVYPEFIYSTGAGDCKTSDVVLIYGNSAIFLEATASRIRMEATALSGDLQAFDGDLDKIILQNAQQLTDRIRDFRNGLYSFDGITSHEINRIYPAIVTIHSMPEATPIWNYIREQLKKRNLLQEDGVEPLQLIDIEEMEILEAILQQGLSLLQVLQGRAADPERRNIGLKNYLIAKYQIGVNEHLWAEFLEMGAYTKTLLFGQGE